MERRAETRSLPELGDVRAAIRYWDTTTRNQATFPGYWCLKFRRWVWSGA